MNNKRASLTSTTPPHTPPQPSYRLSNRFSPLQDEEEFPALPEPRDSQNSPVTSPPVRRPQRTRQAKVKTISHQGTTKSWWRAPVSRSRILILGDSNIKGFKELKADSSVGPVESHSYPGARLRHFTDSIWKDSKPQPGPKHVILSVGINNRGNNASTHRDQLKRVINLAEKTYPNAHIYIPQINYTSELKPEVRASLDSLNSLIMELTGAKKMLHTIPKLSSNLFNIRPNDTQKVHWTYSTAESMLAHWLQSLN